MRTYIQPGQTIDFVAPAAVTVDVPVKIGNFIVIPAVSAASGATFPGSVEGVFGPMPADTGAAWSVGDTLYWDDTNKRFTKTSTSNTKAGACVVAKLSADTTSTVKLITQLA